MEDELTAHLTTGAVIVYFIEWMKKAQWIRVITPETKTLNRVASVILAGIASMGINWTYDPTIGQLVITGLTWSAVGMTLWEFLKQFIVQQLLFDGIVEKKGIL